MRIVVHMNKTTPTPTPGADPRFRIKIHRHAFHPDDGPVMDLVAYIVTMPEEPTIEQIVEMGVPIAAVPAEVANNKTGTGVWTFAIRVPSAAGSVCWFCDRSRQ